MKIFACRQAEEVQNYQILSFFTMNDIEKLYYRLRQQYGRPQNQWRLWCRRPKTSAERQRVIMEAILTQRTNWKNAELAMRNLAEAGVKNLSDFRRLYKKDGIRLALLLKPSGFYRQKTEYLFGLAEFFAKKYPDFESKKIVKTSLEQIRKELLLLKGVGPETADSILLYGLDKPIFVIDEYTRRLNKRLKLSKENSYSGLQDFFQKNIPRDFKFYQDFHALIVIDGKRQK